MGYSPLFRGTAAAAPSSGAASDYQNGTSFGVTKATPVSVTTSGQFATTDVSSETLSLNWVGLAALPIASGAIGQIANEGRLEKVAFLGFNTGDPIWVGLNGTLTNIKPDISSPGWASGYWVLFVGVVVKNQFNPSEQDIQLFRQIIGQL